MIFDDLSDEQKDAVERIMAWYNTSKSIGGPKTCYLTGHAGSGKTTLASLVADAVGGLVIFCAFTGKAASVLASKGCPNAMTLHSAIYQPKGRANAKQIEQLSELAQANAATPEQLDQLRTLMEEDSSSFALKEEPPIKEAKLVVVDEVSMLSKKHTRDLESFDVPILYLGDTAQLPPVFGESAFKGRRPDIALKTIHRQAQDSMILRLATAIRTAETLSRLEKVLRYGDYGDVIIEPKADIDWDHMLETGQIIAGRNNTVKNFNRTLRKRRGFRNVLPMEDEKLVCTLNNHDRRVLNGVTCRSTAESQRYGMVATIECNYEGRKITDHMDPGKFEEHYGKRKSFPNMQSGLLQFDFGYALTCHKSQGSQWDDLVVADDRMQQNNFNFRKEWLYTAVTRAAKQLRIYR